MAEEMKAPATKLLNVEIADASHLPVLYVNTVNIRFGTDGFFFTLAVVVPPEIKHPEDLEKIDHLVGKPVAQFSLTAENMKKLIDSASSLYDLYQQQVAALQGSNADNEGE